MRKTLTLLFMAAAICCFGQKRDFLQGISSINFYGVDYSAAKVFGATESPEEFKTAFAEINQLFISEAKKYDVSKSLKIKVDEISLNAVNKVNREIDPDQLMTSHTDYTLTEQEIAGMIKALSIQPTPGVGLVIIAKLLDKAKNYGSYQVVFFDTETKRIIEDYAMGGKAGGFGLRNFWAGSIYKVVKHI